MRETLFNIVASRLAGCRFADLYAGSGAVGIEALSRGAADVLFVERAPAALGAIRANLAALGIRSGFAIEARNAGEVIRRLAQTNEPIKRRFDVVFLDPPWDAVEEYAAILALLGTDPGIKVLEEGAIIIAEHAKRDTLNDRYGLLRRTRTVQQGDAALSFFAVSTNEP